MVLHNICDAPTCLCITGWGVISLSEETTQGDSLELLIYAHAVMLLIRLFPLLLRHGLLMMPLLLGLLLDCWNRVTTLFLSA